MRADLEDACLAFVRGRAAPLRRFAYLLCGDWHLAEDLVQSAYLKIHRAWPRLNRRGTVDRYARQAVLRCRLDESRRPWRRAESRDGVVVGPGAATRSTPTRGRRSCGAGSTSGRGRGGGRAA